MIVYPAIDLVAGDVVRLRQGVRSEMDVYSSDPVAQAEAFAAAGAGWVHMVDLSRAFGEDEAACDACVKSKRKLSNATTPSMAAPSAANTRITMLEPRMPSRSMNGT